MNITFKSYSDYSSSFLKEMELPSFTDQQKKIALIFSVAISLLVMAFVAARCCFKGNPPVTTTIDPNSVIPIQVKSISAKPLTASNIKFLKENAKCSRHTKNERDGDLKYKGILAYIDQVLAKPEFQKDPKAYIKKWKVERGGSEEFRVVEDSAMNFFDSMIEYNVIK